MRIEQMAPVVIVSSLGGNSRASSSWAQAHTEEERRREFLRIELIRRWLKRVTQRSAQISLWKKCPKAKTRKILEDILTENNNESQPMQGSSEPHHG